MSVDIVLAGWSIPYARLLVLLQSTRRVGVVGRCSTYHDCGVV
jgi:hypothetical protein